MSEMLTVDEEALIAERIVRNKILMAELAEENAQLLDWYKSRPDLYPEGSTKKFGKFYVKVSRNARIDEELAKANLTTLQYKQVSKTVVDAKKAKVMLGDAKYAEIQKVYDPKIEIGLI